MDSKAALQSLVSLRPQFEAASARWPDLSHWLIAKLLTEDQNEASSVPPIWHQRKYTLHTGYMIDCIDPSLQTVSEPPLPPVSVTSRFNEATTRTTHTFTGVDRFLELAAAAWFSLLQCPEPCWALLSLPQGELPNTLVGRMWLASYRRLFDRAKIIAKIEELKASGRELDYEKIYVPDQNEYRMQLHLQPEPAQLWLHAVYSIGWRRVAGGLLKLDRFSWVDIVRFTFRRLESDMPDPSKYATGRLAQRPPRPLRWFASEMGDPFLASCQAIDAIAHAAGPNIDDSAWPTVSDVAKISGMNTGDVSRLCTKWIDSQGRMGLACNGKTGHHRRINPAALPEFLLNLQRDRQFKGMQRQLLSE